MLEIPVKLIVKAPNQQVEDQTIHCNLSWTIKRLKGYLSEVHPSKPNTEDQRLIYYGQLLNDSVTLRDVFTKYEAGEETHTVHLVCIPSKDSLKMQGKKSTEENKSGKEGVIVGGGASTSSQGPVADGIQNMPEGNPNFTGSANGNYFQSGYQNWMAGVQTQDPAANNYIQQWNWMQQAYANYYMNHYLNMIARQHAVREDAREDEDDQQPVARVRNIEDEERRNHIHRDWLDCLYTMSRFIVLLSIVYFYSSPTRFLIVSSLGLLLYLYQIGFFRLQPFEENEMENNNAGANNNNMIEPEDEGEEVEAEDVMPHEPIPNARAEPPNPDLNRNANLDANPIQDPNPNPNSNGQQAGQGQPQDEPSFLARTWIFVTTFFSSMIPETDIVI